MGYYKNLLKNIDIWLVIIPAIFAVISVVMIGSTSYDEGFVITRDIVVQSVAFFLGAILMLFILMLNYRHFEELERVIYIGSILFLLSVYIPGLGKEQYGSLAWIDLGVTDLQPAELVKITFILCFSSNLVRNRYRLEHFKGLLSAGLFALPFILIIVKEDLGNAIVVCVIFVVMVFYAGISYKLFAQVSGLVLFSTPILYRFMAGHQKDRIDAFLHPENLSLPGNYQVWNSKVAIGSGGFWGKGLFQGTQKQLDFLPVQKSDFIFAVIVEELGFLGGTILILLYTVFLYRILKIAQNAKDLYGSLVVIGILAMFGFQIFENIAMTMGLMPVTGITLPFLSYGGTSIVTNMVALSLILNVGIRSKIINF